jgi:ATP-binding cassette, subfamily B, bacterial PglK
VSRVSNVVGALVALYGVLPGRRRRQLRWIAVLMTLSAVAEMVSLGALVPFITMMSGAQAADAGFWPLGGMTSRFSGPDGILRLTMMFVLIVGLATTIRIVLNILLARVNFRTGHDIGCDIHAGSLGQPYEYHLLHNSAETVGAIAKVDVAVQVLQAVLTGISSGFVAICICITLLFVNAAMALIVMGVFGGAYIIVSRINHDRLLRNGRGINAMTTKRIQIVKESIGGVREVILDRTHEFHKERFRNADRVMRSAQESNQILMPLPRLLIEGLAMLVLATLCCVLALRGVGLLSAIPTLIVLAVGGQRLLPLLQQAYQGWAMVSGHLAVIADVSMLARSHAPAEPDLDVPKIELAREIRFDRVAFGYSGAPRRILQDVDLQIPVGACVGIVGPTGGGKSTLLNLLMGLLRPVDGRIVVDGEALAGGRIQGWQMNIAHVPQSIFLADATVLENVALGVHRENIDVQRAMDALLKAHLMPVIDSLPEGLETLVGENGVRLSGGQRQRLGIARALYKRAGVLVLDEATSALDEDTELDIMKSLADLGRDVTVLMVAHRLSTLRSCDFILRVADGRVGRTDAPKEPFGPRDRE